MWLGCFAFCNLFHFLFDIDFPILSLLIKQICLGYFVCYYMTASFYATITGAYFSMRPYLISASVYGSFVSAATSSGAAMTSTLAGFGYL
jgi:hypothetical protein